MMFGAWGNPDHDESVRIVHAALDAGVNFIDTAEEYSVVSDIGTGHSEEFIGDALKGRRDQFVVATKFEMKSHEHPEQQGAERIVRAVEGSLQRLQTDRIDLYQQHFPDPDTPKEVILEALDQLVREGKVVEIGCSNYDGTMIDEALAISEDRGLARFSSAQNMYNLLEGTRQPDLLDAAARHGMSVLPFFPLAAGMLTGKYRRGEAAPEGSRMAGESFIAKRLAGRHLEDARFDKVERLQAWAEEREHSLLELAFCWLASQPVIASIIAGATSPEQIRSNAAAVSGWRLTPDEVVEVRALVEE
jgi:aryl-alcohol dehydrogenase-like predicted oxidoreductase